MKIIELTQGQVALVDDNKYEYLNQWNWCINRVGKTYYAVRTIPAGNKGKTIYMHHEVFGINTPLDHIDGNGWNNQICNLRKANALQNMRNQRKQMNRSSIYKGVTLDKRNGHWLSGIRAGELCKSGKHKRIHIGSFVSEIEAALAYDRVATRCFGVFAKLNFNTCT